jgi:predicted permease
VANLLLARAADRATETAVRLSIGASPGRLIRWLLTEACVLGLLSGAAALLVARLTVNGLLAYHPNGGPHVQFELSPTVLMFTLVVGLGTGVLFGLFPAIASVRAAVGAGLHADSGRTSGTRSTTRFRAALATVQVALATALLAEAGLLIASLVSATRVDLGIQRHGLVMFGLSPSLSGYAPPQARALFDRVEATLEGLPGVTSVSSSTVPLLGGSIWGQNLTVEGFEPPAGGDSNASRSAVGAGYFRTVGIPVLTGREFTASDAGPAPQVAVVNQAFTRKFHLDGQALGKRIAFGQGDDVRPDIEIVGVVGDAVYSGVRDQGVPQLFVPRRQAEPNASTMHFYVRSTADVTPLLAAVRAAVGGMARDVPIEGLRTMDDQAWEGMTRERLLATLMSSFAGLAVVLAGVGLYAVIAYVVARRWREFGIRLALGATTGSIRRAVFADVGRIAVAGALVGGAAALVLARLGEAFLFGIEGLHAPVLAGAIVFAVVAAFGAAAVPVRRAASINPVVALRAE